ncbi:MAG TPA: hypothetical protein VKP30_10255 [Polyangiaceae bacterium]|nr:hypothetical protein [Polyangiaceae bacterium]
MTSASDMPAYLARIGYSGPTAPTRTTLDAITYAHTQSCRSLPNPALREAPSVRASLEIGGIPGEEAGLRQ